MLKLETKNIFFFFCVQTEDVLICGECHKQLVDAYIFRTTALKALPVKPPHRYADLIKNVEEFLGSSDKADDYTLVNFNKSLAIVTSADKQCLQHYGWGDKSAPANGVLEEEDNEDESQNDYESDSELMSLGAEAFVKVETTLNTSVEDPRQSSLMTVICSDNEESENCFESLEQEEVNHAEETGKQQGGVDLLKENNDDNEDSNSLPMSEQTNNKKKRNYSAAPQWLVDDLLKCKRDLRNEEGMISILKCYVCHKVFLSREGMKHHLVANHNPDPPKKVENPQVEKHARDFDWVDEMVLKSKAADEDSWTCYICKEFNSKFLIGINNHILQKHVVKGDKKRGNSRRLSIDDNEQKFKKSFEWIMEQVEESQIDESNWTCCLCKKFSGTCKSGMRTHITHVHTVPGKHRLLKKVRTGDQLHNKEPKHIRDYDWIKEMAKKSETAENDWNCCICNSFHSSMYMGIRIHITQMHTQKTKSKRRSTIDGTPKAEYFKYERTPEFLREMTEKSKVGSQWNCCLCHDFKSRHAIGIRAHITQVHTNKPIKIKVEAEEEAPRFKRDPVWVNETIQNSKVENEEESWVCCICKKFTTSSMIGIRYHIFQAHCEKKEEFYEQETADEPDDDRHERDPDWIKEKVEESKGEDGINWSCCICSDFTTQSPVGMRIHIDRMHCKRARVATNGEASKLTEECLFKHSDSIESNIRNSWIKEKMEMSKIESENGIVLNCTICQSSLEDLRALKRHIERVHRGELEDATAEKIKETFEELDNIEIIDFMEKCRRQMTGFDDIYVCLSCKGIIFTSKAAIHQHICIDHFRFENYKNPFIGEKRRLSLSETQAGESGPVAKRLKLEPSDVGYIDQLKSCAKVVLNDVMNLIKPKVIVKPVDEEKTCDSGDEKEVESKLQNTTGLSKKESRWLKLSIRRSKVVGTKSYDCWICKENLTFHSSIQYHLKKFHLPFYKMTSEKYREHKDDCIKGKWVRPIRPIKIKRERIRLPKGQAKANGLKVKIAFKSKRCNGCDFKFKEQRSYRAHMKIHFLTDPVVKKLTLHECEVCSMLFRNLEDYNMHKSFHESSDKPQTIPAEGFKFANFISQKHRTIVSHHEESESSRFCCGHCGNKYGTDLEIKRHVLFHHMHPLICPVDKMSFAKMNEFITHISACHWDGFADEGQCNGNVANSNSILLKVSQIFTEY